jgi:hypothetical protein
MPKDPPGARPGREAGERGRDEAGSASGGDLRADRPVDLAVGVHAQNQVRQVAQVLEAAEAALVKHFSAQRAAVLVADAGSQDGTRERLREWSQAPRGAIVRAAIEVPPPAGRGRAVVELLGAVRSLGAPACALVDAGLAGLGPEWLDLLLGAIIRGDADFVSPVYSRTISEGTLTTNLLAPLTRALYGVRVHQLAGGGAGLSGGALARALAGPVASAGASAQGIEIALLTDALAGGGRVVEAHLGRRPVEPQVAQPDLATTIVRTVGPLFGLMERYDAAWRDVRGSAPIPLLGGLPTAVVDSGPGPVVERMVRAFKLGMKDLLPLWEQVMPETTLSQLYPLAVVADDEFEFPPAVWAGVVADFAIAYHERRLPLDHLLRSLTPLYLGRVAAFHREARARPLAGFPDALERIARAFEAEKERLVARWR